MKTSERVTVRWWRWRRNALKRRIDVVEAWVVLAGWVFALLGGVGAGLMAAGAVERAVERQRAGTRQVTAVAVKDAPGPAPARAASDHRVWATVRWTAPDGSTHTDEARVPPRTPAGSTIPVWVNQSGDITTPPVSESEAWLHTTMGGGLAGALAGGTVLAAVWLTRLSLDRRRMAQWQAEWDRIDTRRGWKTG
ncbi:Rv1733c family protein [Streptomyces coeruleorubidus]|uniref:Rv1733c family protein n=1 Tax=Streptomyces coeruleorubidus TaxID=116188 RepID=UPI0033A94A9F